MSKVNWDLTRIGKCKYNLGSTSMFIENEDLVYSKHTGKNAIQFWTGKDDDLSIDGWACAHTDNDDEEIEKYKVNKEIDLKS